MDPGEEYAEAMKAYDHAIELNASLWQAHVNRAEIRKREGNFEEARAEVGKEKETAATRSRLPRREPPGRLFGLAGVREMPQ